MMLWEYIRERMLRYPTQKVKENDAYMTYEELVVYAEKFAKKLSREKHCAIFCSSEMATAMALLACFAAGVTAVPLSIRYGKAHVDKILKVLNPSCMITDQGGELGVIYFDRYDNYKIDGHPALIMWTSGTTGVPKGAMLSEKNILTNIQDISVYFKIDASDTILIARPLYHSGVLTGEFLTALNCGTQIIFCSKPFDPNLLIRILRDNFVTVFCGTPTLMQLMLKFVQRNEGIHVKHISVSGECMSKETGLAISKTFCGANIYYVYGLTEACPRVSYMPPEHFQEAPDCVGVPLKSVQVEIRDDSNMTVRQGERGVLWVKGESVMLGYYNAPDLTAEKLKDGWLCTGDLAVINENGWLKILGRSDDLIIRAGVNIYPQEIEAELIKDPRTVEVLAYGYDDLKMGVQIALKIVGSFKNTDEVRKICIDRLPSYQIPSRIELVEDIPKNGSGKIVRPKQKGRCT